MILRASSLRMMCCLILLSMNHPAFSDIHVFDQLKREVRVKTPVQRIVTLAPHAVENTYSAGAGDKIVGTVEYSDYPESALSIERVGRANAYSLEKIASLKPDLIIVWRSGNGEKVMQQLVRLGFTVYASEPHSLTDIAKEIRDIGLLAGTETIAEDAALAYEKKLHALTETYAGKTTVNTLYQVWDTPLQTLNGKHIISRIIELCGGENIFADAKTLAPKVSMESVIARNPEAIFAGANDGNTAWQARWQGFPKLKAVANQQLYGIPPDIISRHTARILDGANLLCEHLDKVREKRTTN